MKKDVIYIDTEDDITSIIEKVKASQEKIVALVPPKRVGVLQSAVNLKLLQKVAHTADKRVVLITANHALGALAAGVQIPVAKTLQSRPELLKANDAPRLDDEEVINGDEMPVGELATATPSLRSTNKSDEEIELPADLGAADEPKTAKSPKKLKKAGTAVPNFDTFRKKLFLGIGVGVLLIIFLVWATVFAPRATVNISAKTDPIDISLPITLKADVASNTTQGIIQPVVQQVKKTTSSEFTATGKKDVGEKATGTMTITRTSLSPNKDITVPAGTPFSDGNLTFVSIEAGTLGKPFSCDSGDAASQCSTTVRVQAAAVGEDYNLSSRNYQTISGVSATGSTMTGGSKKQVTIVSQDDVNAAQQKLSSQDQEAIKKELETKFAGATATVVRDTFVVSAGTPTVTPAVGAEAAKGQLTVETTYSMSATRNSDIDTLLDTFLKSKIKGEKNQQVYDNGRKALKYTKYDAASGTVRLVSTGHVGPKIDSTKLKKQLVGKNYEEIRQIVSQTEGIQDVDTKFSPFWVSSVGSEEKIDIKFKVSRDGSSN